MVVIIIIIIVIIIIIKIIIIIVICPTHLVMLMQLLWKSDRTHIGTRLCMCARAWLVTQDIGQCVYHVW